MCGIFAILGKQNYGLEEIENAFNNGMHRGPEYSKIKKLNKVILGFHRLAINGLNAESHQPINIDSVSLICNGEIYNYKELYNRNNITPITCSDCEIIIHLYKKYGIETTVQMLDGVFAFVLVDEYNGKIYVARDRYGVRPLFIMENKFGSINNVSVASEMKQLHPLMIDNCYIKQFEPGTLNCYSIIRDSLFEDKVIRFKYFPFPRIMEEKGDILKKINLHLRAAVKKRVTSTERPIACLLSGGLDSSLITSLVCSYFDDPSKLETYSIGLPGSVDLQYAKKVADFLGTNHTSIIVQEEDFLAAIPEVIEAIESYDTTTVRASVGNYLVAKYIKEHSEAKVIFNGDGSDEVSGGYLYFHKSPDSVNFDKECKRLLNNIHYFDVLRSDRCISHFGLEARTPFLDINFVDYYLGIDAEVRNHCMNSECEKYLIRKAFDDDNILPKEVLWRTKEAFSDGVSSKKKAWYEMIQDSLVNFSDNTKNFYFNKPVTNEQKYYRNIFDQKFKNMEHIIPYFWMPNFVNATDCSARSLEIYNKPQTAPLITPATICNGV